MSSQPWPTVEQLRTATAEEAVSFARRALEELEPHLPEESRTLAASFLRALPKGASGALYRDHFVPLIDQFFMHHGSEFGPAVSAQSKVTAHCIVRLNAAERRSGQQAPVMPDDVREVTPGMVLDALAKAGL